MIVPSLEFLTFVLIGAGLYNISSAKKWHEMVLLIMNVLFLASFSQDPVAFVPLAGFLGLGFIAVQLLQEKRSSVLFAVFLMATLGAFFWLKRYSFVPSASFLPSAYVTIGLSYVSFRVLHLIIDAEQDAIGHKVRALDYVNYTLNFTSLISGPIQRYQDYWRMQYEMLEPLDVVVIAEALERVLLGFFKVLVMSKLLLIQQKYTIAVLSIDQPLEARVLTGVAIVVLYPLYLYFNFSGYVDTVIGAARLFRLTLPENFDKPFRSENFINFWGRWHITLSSWLKTYVYNPLLGALMRRIVSPVLEPLLGVFALFVTFFLVGAWHGQTSEFLFFGALTGAGVAGNKLYQILMGKWLGRKEYRALSGNWVYRALSRGLTFTWFAFTLLWFWSDWRQIGMLGDVLGVQGIAAATLVTVLGATIWLAVYVAAVSASYNRVLASRYVRTAAASAQAAVLVALTHLDSSTPDIIYKAF